MQHNNNKAKQPLKNTFDHFCIPQFMCDLTYFQTGQKHHSLSSIPYAKFQSRMIFLQLSYKSLKTGGNNGNTDYNIINKNLPLKDFQDFQFIRSLMFQLRLTPNFK